MVTLSWNGFAVGRTLHRNCLRIFSCSLNTSYISCLWIFSSFFSLYIKCSSSPFYLINISWSQTQTLSFYPPHSNLIAGTSLLLSVLYNLYESFYYGHLFNIYSSSRLKAALEASLCLISLQPVVFQIMLILPPKCNWNLFTSITSPAITLEQTIAISCLASFPLNPPFLLIFPYTCPKY